VNLDSDGEPGKPKALVAYPGARCLVGANNIERGFGHWVAGEGHTADHWTLSRFTVTAHISPVLLGSGYRVVGNYVTAPTGSAPGGVIEGSGNDLFVLGNEITKVGRPGCSKLYHPIYISSARASSGARRPPEANREVAWNYLHDNSAVRGINIYSERASTAYMSGHWVHDNFIVDQVSDGMLLGQYMTGENWVYNNVIVRAGLGPEPDPRESEASSHFGVSIDAGHETVTNTVIRFYHNTIYSCGWSGARRGANGAVHLVHLNRYTLHFGNNLIVSTGEPYLSGWSDKLIPPTRARNLWFGAGAPPAWDLAAIGAEPRFVDAAHDDFRLQPNSPAIDTGADVAVRTDFNGVSRPQGTSPDLGAYEFEKEQPKAVPAKGPLRVHPTNPRYFTDGSGKAILLTGSHTWGNLQDYRYATLPSPPPMDFPAYLAFMQRHHHNFFRLWAWETSFNPNAKQSTISYDPMLYQRPGSGSALDGKPKFDLSLFNPAYFDRLRARVMAARDRGIYVSVILGRDIPSIPRTTSMPSTAAAAGPSTRWQIRRSLPNKKLMCGKLSTR
jgi:hypothetical protein